MVKVRGVPPPAACAMLCLLCIYPAYSQPGADATNPVTVQDVRIAQSGRGVEVEIIASGEISAKTDVLHHPERLMIDIPNARFGGLRKVAVGSDCVSDVRAAQHSSNPPITRVVIDLEGNCTYKLLPKGATISVQLAPEGTVKPFEPELRTVSAKLHVAVPVSAGQASTNQPEKPESASSRNASGYRYTGAGGCAASSCHGSVQPKTLTRINQNEYTIWAGQDKHANAYSVLSNPVSARMGKILNIGPPDKAAKCLACHSLDVAAELRTQRFGLEDGVSCENCHGPSSGWLGPHTQANWPHEKSVSLGMYDTRDLMGRSAKCATCHVGSAEKFVDHEMIAAGHPDLTFELEYFTKAMPAHWKMPEDPWFAVKAWSVSEATQLSASLRRLAWRAGRSNWPEYAELECFACHHSLTMPSDSWRQMEGYPGRRPGTPPWNAARYVIFRHAVEQVNPEAEKQLRSSIMKITELMDNPREKGPEIAAAASHAADLSDKIARQFDSQRCDQRFTLQVMRSIAEDGTIAQQGERAAEQAYMSLDSLFEAYRRNVKAANDSEIQAAIAGLFQQFNNPSAYNGPRFAAQMQKVQSLLGRGGTVADASK